ncbi:SE1561 family protein [Salirhabdus sp. Marseille-P4669]|uniref:SE1561 family protein n=1 Tax=Salirhabdus sp. Marseille-P4669 TaxID=2042310 RepID=UPI00190EC0B0|nr:SE1561 family protein [Salirhabdus sp. Marseille-P4669]
MSEQEDKIAKLRKRLEEVMTRIEGISPDQMTVEDIDHFIHLLDELEEKCR